jgi:hypothetical protein
VYIKQFSAEIVSSPSVAQRVYEKSAAVAEIKIYFLVFLSRSVSPFSHEWKIPAQPWQFHTKSIINKLPFYVNYSSETVALVRLQNPPPE